MVQDADLSDVNAGSSRTFWTPDPSRFVAGEEWRGSNFVFRF